MQVHSVLVDRVYHEIVSRLQCTSRRIGLVVVPLNSICDLFSEAKKKTLSVLLTFSLENPQDNVMVYCIIKDTLTKGSI
jgi:hypothetical protein